MRDVTGLLWETGDELSSGADPKVWVTDGSRRFLLKRGQKRFPLEPYSEYVASRFISQLGIPVQEVELVTFRGRVWALCSYVGNIKQFKDISDSSIFSDVNKEFWVLAEVLSVIAGMRKLSVDQRLNFVSTLKLLFVVDGVLANGDRHAGNFGYFQNGDMSPVYDNGASLFPDIVQLSMTFCSVEELLRTSVCDVPVSTIQLKDIPKHTKKETYYQMIPGSKVVVDEIKHLKSVNIGNVISYSVEGLSVEFQRFYSYVLRLRYEVFINQLPFNRALAIVKNMNFKYPESVGELCTQLRI